MRRVVRILGSAALTVAVGVAVNQILNGGELSGPWLYVSLAVAVLAFLYSEGPTAAARARGVRNSRRIYLRQLRASVQDMETVGIATHSEFVLRMHQVYVDVSLAPKTVQAAAVAPYLGTVPDEEGAAPGTRRTLTSVLQDAEQADATRILAVIGGPGSGKTTLARSTALALCEHGRRPWARRLPVLLYLRDHAAALLADEPPPLAEVAVTAGWLEGKVSAEWLARRLDAGRCLVLLDGLDEVADPADRSRVVAWVVRQKQRHPRNLYVVTSRPHGYHSNPLPGAEVLQVRRFTGDQISRYLHQWHYAMEARARALTRREAQGAADGPLTRLRTRADTDRHVRAAADRSARDLLARLRAQPALYDLASNPLLLTMIANVHRYAGQLPGSRAELYAEMCDVLLHRRYEVRGLRDGTGLTGPHKQHVVQHLALAMMRARVRDWPAADAAQAIRRPLRQVPGGVTPEVFLEEGRKSGLLVERDHGLYGFAHLTLQEYLAAALLSTPRADTGLLTANVGDPWWRETLLLWCAGNDATDVITACLDSGTVPALALAADCADQARTVDPAVRDRLEAQLAPPGPDQPYDSDRERLLAGIHATRLLRETIPLGGSSALCTRPVPVALYRFFVRDEEAAGRSHRHPLTLGRAGGDDGGAVAVAVGMHAGDAERFVTWLNSVTGSSAYRLPRPEELSSPQAPPSPDEWAASEDLEGPVTALASVLELHTVWAQDGTRTVLHQPPAVRWPFAVRSDHLGATATADRLEAGSCLRVLTATPRHRDRLAGWAAVLEEAFARAPELSGDPSLAPLAHVLALCVSRTLTGNLDLARLAAGVGREAHTLTILHVLARAGLALERSGARVNAFRDLAGPAHDLALVVPPDTSADDATADFARWILDIEDALGRGRSLDVPGLELGPAREDDPRGLAQDLATALDEAHAFGLVSGTRSAPDLAGELDPGVFGALANDMGDPVDPDLDLDSAIDAALDLALAAHDRTLDIAVRAHRVVATRGAWMPSSGGETPTLAGLDDAMVSTRPSAFSPLPWIPEDPVDTLRRAHESLRAGGPPIAASLLEPLALLVGRCLEPLSAFRDRQLPWDGRILARIRFALNAVTAVLYHVCEYNLTETTLLEQTWLSLVAQDAPAVAGGPAPNQILMIVRDEGGGRGPNADVRPSRA
ncbi:NACHT domain-containing NTPase [Streptomyces sp. NRRL S-87]|uniref:NACHT domain-containing protein n=1 Tax=Streptomyces sp. NRRL S-87 TaxID=1463920 RepID=UPI00068B4226|nr:NACHT domain-containing protein [Streptomyces sp. NRRL S-87]